MNHLTLYQFMNDLMPEKPALVCTALGYALFLFLIIFAYKYVNADLRYAGL